jgi:hypothetical protein
MITSFKKHALRRMFSRKIRIAHVEHVLAAGEIVEEYPNDKPYPSRLIFGFCGTRPIHIVAAANPETDETT